MNTNKPICVTGASGFIAAHIVEQLLSKGYQVRGTVRNADNRQKYQYLYDLDRTNKRLELVSANLLEAEGFKSAVAGCEYIIHTASPYALNVKDPKKDLLDPAVNGTRFLLDAAMNCSEIKRIVLTSSVAAITDSPALDKVLTESDWNSKSSLKRNPYYYSKTAAEQEAWRIVKTEKPLFDLVVINPFVVIGPSYTPKLNPSNQILVDILTGQYPGIMNLTWGMVDVRDVAKAHILAMENEGASGRYLCANRTITMKNLVELLSNLEPNNSQVPKFNLVSRPGNLLIRFASYFQPSGVGSYLRTHIGKGLKFDNGKIKRELGIKFIDLEKSIRDTITDLKKWQHLLN